MQVFVTGATGFVGRAVVARLLRDGHAVSAWVRSPAQAAERLGPQVELIAAAGGPLALQAAVARAEAVVNLAGEPVLPKRWSAARKQVLWDSRIGVTRQIVDAMAMAPRPRVFVSTSATGYYGDTGERPVDEDSPPGADFLAELAAAWEAAARAAEAHGARVCVVRFGLVLGRDGGVLRQLVPVFKLGLGGPVGGGQQWFPWVHLSDLVDLVVRPLSDPQLAGPVNGVAPGVVTNKEFGKALGRALHRPAVVPVPRFALKLALGEASEALLASHRVVPRRAEALGFRFAFPDLDAALADLLR